MIVPTMTHKRGTLWGSLWVCQALHWVRQVFGILTCWYHQRESLVLGVLPNMNSQCEGVHVAVEYRLKSKGVS